MDRSGYLKIDDVILFPDRWKDYLVHLDKDSLRILSQKLHEAQQHVIKALQQ